MYYYDSLNKLSPICLRLNTFVVAKVFPHILIRTPSWPAAKNTYFICCCFFNLMGNFIENVPFIFSYIIKRFGKRHVMKVKSQHPHAVQPSQRSLKDTNIE